MSHQSDNKGWAFPDFLQDTSKPTLAAWQSYVQNLPGVTFHDNKDVLKKLAATCKMSSEDLVFALTFPKSPGKHGPVRKENSEVEGIALFYEDHEQLATVWLPYDDNEYTYLDALEEIAFFVTDKPLQKPSDHEARPFNAVQPDQGNSGNHNDSPGLDLASIKQRSDNLQNTLQEKIDLFNEIPGVSAEEYDRRDDNDPLLFIRVPFNREHLLNGNDPECRDFHLEIDGTFSDGDDEDQGERSETFNEWLKPILKRQHENWQYFYNEVVRLAGLYVQLPVLLEADTIAQIKESSDQLDNRLDEIADIFERIPGVETERGDDDQPDILLVIKVPFNNSHVSSGDEAERFKYLLKADDTVDEEDFEDEGETSEIFDTWRKKTNQVEMLTAQLFYDRVLELSKAYAAAPPLQEHE